MQYKPALELEIELYAKFDTAIQCTLQGSIMWTRRSGVNDNCIYKVSKYSNRQTHGQVNARKERKRKVERPVREGTTCTRCKDLRIARLRSQYHTYCRAKALGDQDSQTKRMKRIAKHTRPEIV